MGSVLLFLAALLVGVLIPHQRYHLGVVPVEWLLLPLGAAGLLGACAMVAKPNRLIISPQGLEYRELLSVQRLPWMAVESVGLWGTWRRPNQAVRLGLSWGESLDLSGGWPIDGDAVAALIERARLSALAGKAPPRPATMSKIKSAHGALF